MDITVKGILDKYPTKFTEDDISEKLLNTVIIGEKNWNGPIPTLDELEEPTVTQSGQGYKYTYKLGEYKITMDNFLDEFTVELSFYDGQGHPPQIQTWTNNDEIYY